MHLVADQLCVDRGERRIVSGVSFAAQSGQALVITGPNGAGKSTLLKAIAGLLPMASGTARLEGGDEEQNVGAQCHYLAHNNALKGALTVGENLSFWQGFLGAPRMSVAQALETVRLPGIADLPAAYLSAGQKRRATIARLLVSFRPVWLLDEPTSALDAASSALFADIVRSHLAQGGIAVAATHLDLGLENVQRLELLQVHDLAAVENAA